MKGSDEFELTHPRTWTVDGRERSDGRAISFLEAKERKDDEFYTRMEDVKAEIERHRDAFRGKVVYSNCDSEWSSFVKFFEGEGDRLGIAEFLWHPGPFGGSESIELLRRADIVVTNPPFSLFGQFVEQLTIYAKDFLIVGPMIAVNRRGMHSLVQRGVARLGYESISEFGRPAGKENAAVNCVWFTTLPVDRDPLLLTEKFSEEAYPRYDNCDAIDVSRVADIPSDYDGIMGVPVSFLTKHDPAQFDVLRRVEKGNPLITKVANPRSGYGALSLRSKVSPARILIRKRRSR